ncbi:MAG TPA: Gfo/Idh/MocA family oxidoreductase [Clostridiales bacterium]|nr:Gfo/Idh/MocA family oxidoreductase [Clostridiales bacterium]
MRRLKAGIVGTGYIGISHIETIRRIGFAELVAVADVNYDMASRRAKEYYIPKCYGTLDELLADKEIDVIHNCTPNNLHLEVNEKIIKAGKHIFSEKPLARNSEESLKLLLLLNENKNIIHGMNYNYRMNPLVQEMKSKVKNGEIGQPKLVHGSYLQDWLLFDTDYNWRIEPEICGPSRCIADIGTHWMDAVQTIIGAKIVELTADLVTTIPIRKKPKGQVETFSITGGTEYEEVEVKTEDYGSVIFKMDNGVRGVFCASEVSAGRKCYLNFEIDGTRSSMYWNQEMADQMWMGFREKDNSLVMRNPNLMTPEAKQYTYLAAGHPEGWNDAMRNNVYSFYKYIADGKTMGKDPCDFATFDEGHYLIKLTEAILESNKTRQWVKVE